MLHFAFLPFSEVHHSSLPQNGKRAARHPTAGITKNAGQKKCWAKDGLAAQTEGLAAQANGQAAQRKGLAAQTSLAAHSNRGASGAVPFGNKIAAGCAGPKTSALGALLVHLSHQGGIDLQAHSCELKFNRFARKGILP